MSELLFILVAMGIGFGGGTMYERRKWRKSTGVLRAEQYRVVEAARQGGTQRGPLPK